MNGSRDGLLPNLFCIILCTVFLGTFGLSEFNLDVYIVLVVVFISKPPYFTISTKRYLVDKIVSLVGKTVSAILLSFIPFFIFIDFKNGILLTILFYYSIYIKTFQTILISKGKDINFYWKEDVLFFSISTVLFTVILAYIGIFGMNDYSLLALSRYLTDIYLIYSALFIFRGSFFLMFFL